MKKLTAKQEQARKVRLWEERNIVYGAGYYTKGGGYSKSLSDSMSKRGYDAMRISPAITNKFGLRYRKVYGTAVEPNYSMSKRGEKYYPKVNWYLQGYIKAGKTKGTYLLRLGLTRDFKKVPLYNQLMIKKK